MRRNFRNGLAACAAVAGAMLLAAVCLGLSQWLPQWWQARRPRASLPARGLGAAKAYGRFVCRRPV